MKRQFTPARLDVRAFADDGATLSDQQRVGDFGRLAAEAGDGGRERPLSWSAQGELRDAQHVHPQVWLHLKADTVLPMTCQRCLEPVDVPLVVDRSFRFVADEETASALDDEAEEDLLAISRAFDLPGLVEDELLMAMPVVPRHEACPTAVKLSVEDPDFEQPRPENPFARLRVIKGGR
jgi:uncharacterized protein